MQKVQLLGKRRGAWLALPLSVALGAATALLWPQGAAQQVLIATTDLSSGTVLTSADFARVSVQIGESASLYLTELPAGVVLANPLVQGELLTRSNLTPTPLRTLLPTVLVFKDPLPADLRAGSRVDVWATEQAGEPAPIALECEVANIRAETALGQKAVAVEVNCLPEFLPTLLKAKATQSAIALVPQPTLLKK
jgi:hypothetical protein